MIFIKLIALLYIVSASYNNIYDIALKEFNDKKKNHKTNRFIT